MVFFILAAYTPKTTSSSSRLTASLKELMCAAAETRGRVDKLARDGVGVDVLGGVLAA